MARCRCTDISNINSDCKKLTNAKTYLYDAMQDSKSVLSDAFKQLDNNIRNGATPNNVSVFLNVYNKVEQPIYDSIKNLHDKCANRINTLPTDMKNLECEDISYHAAATTTVSRR